MKFRERSNKKHEAVKKNKIKNETLERHNTARPIDIRHCNYWISIFNVFKTVKKNIWSMSLEQEILKNKLVDLKRLKWKLYK